MIKIQFLRGKNSRVVRPSNRQEIAKALEKTSGEIQKVYLIVQKIQTDAPQDQHTTSQLMALRHSIRGFEVQCEASIANNRDAGRLCKQDWADNGEDAMALGRQVEKLKQDALDTSKTIYGYFPCVDRVTDEPVPPLPDSRPDLLERAISRVHKIFRSGKGHKSEVKLRMYLPADEVVGISTLDWPVELRRDETAPSQFAVEALPQAAQPRVELTRVAGEPLTPNVSSNVTNSGNHSSPSITSADYYNRYDYEVSSTC
ncbi:hypothetical protein FRC12_006692 [Ceratobasidium sp. 428]|nr:hypothetical protein FRC12_006692 [Ceratobasidium sp. 428]